MTLDKRARATAFRLLAKYGKPCVLLKVTRGAYDPDTGTTPSSETGHNIKLYLDSPNKAELESGQVVHTDEVAIFAALNLPVEPAINDKVTVNGRNRNVKMVTRVWSGEQVALWRVGLES